MILPIFECGFFGAITADGNVFIGYTSLRKYMPKYINQLATEIVLNGDSKTA